MNEDPDNFGLAWGAPPSLSPFNTSPNIPLDHHQNPLSHRAGSPSLETPGGGQGNGHGSGSRIKRRRESSLTDSGPLDENRPLAITCTPCRARKIKCDSKKPTCENCSRNPADCIYPVKQKPGLRPGTGLDMMRRLEQLEERVQRHEARFADQEALLSQVSQWQQSQPSSSSLAPSASSLLSLQTPISSMPPPVLAPTLMPNFSPVDIAPVEIAPTSTGTNTNTLDLGSFGANASPGAGSSVSFTDPHVLPPEDIVRDLINLFYTHIHPWAPILSPNPLHFNPPWNIVVYAIVVVTLRLSNDSRIANSKQQFRAAAKQHVLAHAIESTSISSVQALALLALDLIGSEQGPSSWGILALLTRSAVHLGLVVEDDIKDSTFPGRAPTPSLSRMSIIPPAANWNEDEARRRLFWLIFCLDRYACVSTGWDFALPDFEIKRRLPCADDIWARTDWYFAPQFRPVLHREGSADMAALSPMAYLVEGLDLLGRAHTLQVRVVDPTDSRAIDLRKDMTMTLTTAAKRWFAALPFLNSEQTAMTLMIQGIHHATLLKLNAYYAFPALSNGVPVEPYGEICKDSCLAVVNLCSTARSIGFKMLSTPLFIWSSWVAARVIFVHDFLSHKEKPGHEFDIIVSALKEQAPFWALANQYVKLLERAKRKWLSGASLDSEANPSLPEAIHVLLDLRRTAYSAVGVNGQATPYVSPPEVNLSHLPAWAVQPLLGDLHNWFDLPAGLFSDTM